MPARRQGSEGTAKSIDSRTQRHVDAHEALANDVANTANYQTDLSSASDRNAALGDSTGNARESADAAGLDVGENAIDDTQAAFERSRGDRRERDPNQRF